MGQPNFFDVCCLGRFLSAQAQEAKFSGQNEELVSGAIFGAKPFVDLSLEYSREVAFYSLGFNNRQTETLPTRGSTKAPGISRGLLWTRSSFRKRLQHRRHFRYNPNGVRANVDQLRTYAQLVVLIPFHLRKIPRLIFGVHPALAFIWKATNAKRRRRLATDENFLGENFRKRIRAAREELRNYQLPLEKLGHYAAND